MIMSILFLKYNAIKKIFFGIIKSVPATQQKYVQSRTLKHEQKESSHNSTSEGTDVVSKSWCSCHLPYNTALKGLLPTSSIKAIGRKGISSYRYCYHWDAEQGELEREYTFTFNQSIKELDATSAWGAAVGQFPAQRRRRDSIYW